MNYSYEFKEMIKHDEGYFKGYVTGVISFHDTRDHDHDLLYRIHDPFNGTDNTIVSIDWGFTIPYINDVWDEIEKKLQNMYN